MCQNSSSLPANSKIAAPQLTLDLRLEMEGRLFTMYNDLCCAAEVADGMCRSIAQVGTMVIAHLRGQHSLVLASSAAPLRRPGCNEGS